MKAQSHITTFGQLEAVITFKAVSGFLPTGCVINQPSDGRHATANTTMGADPGWTPLIPVLRFQHNGFPGPRFFRRSDGDPMYQ